MILRNISVYNCLELLALARDREHGAACFAAIADAALRYVVNSFETLAGLRSEAELREALGAEVYESLVAAAAERRALAEEIRAGLGRVLERKAPQVAPLAAPSVAGKPVSYPREALMGGVVWPEGVQAACREEWLSPEEFTCLFGLNWAEFDRLPGWKKERCRKEAGLF
ncbi:hypothetical protein HYH03_010475 [Edaphochlamys debaryana]|uniref:HP domain-containing protein n=1 Tax=Edaphochlamys debaryana TaxID=47281 RepID=A0A835XTR3_9CHLO|nr:hypothetical protein HYH03_010475 [Edaphochlamys debaryana]|eukprot:KAG2491027.1 hypothetical protein HYH03_010475 [Edaphochlamys debaryana]